MQANVAKEAFVTRSGSFATRGSRRGVNLLNWESPENLTPEEERDALVARWKQLNNIICSLKKGSPERKALSKEVHQVAQAIHAIRPKIRCPGIEKYVMEIARNKMGSFKFKRLCQEAERIGDQRRAGGQPEKTLENLFVDVIREKLTKVEFDIYMTQAKKLRALEDSQQLAEVAT